MKCVTCELGRKANLKTIFEKIKLAFECFKSSPCLWLIAFLWSVLIGLLAAGDFEKWPPVLALMLINVFCLFNIPTEEEWRQYHQQHPNGDM